MIQYIVTGMSCAACSARVEKAVSKVPGVTSCSVSLLTNSMGVEGTATEQEIIKAVKDAGYGASKKRRRSSEGAAGTGFGRRGYAKRQRDAGTKETSDRIGGISDRPYVFLHGTYDVGLAGSGIHERQSCNDGTVTDASDDCSHGDQPEVFHQWIQRTDPPGTEYGYPGGTWIRSVFCIQYVCTVCNDRCADAWGYGCSNVLYA